MCVQTVHIVDLQGLGYGLYLCFTIRVRGLKSCCSLPLTLKKQEDLASPMAVCDFADTFQFIVATCLKEEDGGIGLVVSEAGLSVSLLRHVISHLVYSLLWVRLCSLYNTTHYANCTTKVSGDLPRLSLRLATSSVQRVSQRLSHSTKAELGPCPCHVILLILLQFGVIACVSKAKGRTKIKPDFQEAPSTQESEHVTVTFQDCLEVETWVLACWVYGVGLLAWNRRCRPLLPDCFLVTVV